MFALNFCLITRPRSGSQFLLSMVRAAMGEDASTPASTLTPGRTDNSLVESEIPYKAYRDRGEPLAYLKDNAIKLLKIEDPERDDLAEIIGVHYPDCRFLSSFRPFEQIARSHFKIKWGQPTEKLIENYKNHVDFLERITEITPVYFVDVTDQNHFNLDAFCQFMAIEENKLQNPRFFANWPVINPLNYQVEKHGEAKRGEPFAIPDAIRAKAEQLDAIMLDKVRQSNAIAHSSAPS